MKPLHMFPAVAALLVFAFASSIASAEVYNIRDPRYRGLIAFSNGPDPTSRTPVYFVRSDSRTLHHLVTPEVAAAKFGRDWHDTILFCGRPQADRRQCDEFRTYRIGRPITMNSQLYGTFRP